MAPRRKSANPPARGQGRLLAVRLLAAGVGVAAGLGLLGLMWPEGDRAVKPEELPTAEALADVPSRAITVLLIGSDADRRGAVRNGAAPAGPANSGALVLGRVEPKGPLQVLSLPTELAVRLPGQQTFQPLGGLYRQGGVALSADVVRELVGLAPRAAITPGLPGRIRLRDFDPKKQIVEELL